MAYWTAVFGVSLGLTMLIELPIAFLWGLRDRRHLALVMLVNVLTNPVAVALHTAAGIPQLPIELAVVLAEWAIYGRFSRTEGWHVPHPAALALVSNAASWILGLWIQQ